ncbi:hemagglutinin repeat-containing protein [Fusobacterium pseudoperiodonticum]|uniref:Hemolysin n=1 Tax=Fusobacterium pseudoperiodonticum TaxID=2663009 RepID=A0A2D3NYE5_9FUSO|nr:hemagglutinin repeat-containing protein [Fusobacterium pseudoperiodonticum]ATV60036.1 hemolysin [Fusobacterium pseudoperiodonticum]
MRGNLRRLIAIFMLFLHIGSLANGIVPDSATSKDLKVDKASNGVPLVNIEAPDKNGTSHNVYKDYNVDGKGVILNNSKDLTQSQLGGLIYGNPNLQNGKEASTIINEVSGVNRSRIEGYQEIAGKKADYILANPNGIYINGAGFINTGNVTLTTGSGDNILNPEKGKIEIDGKGIDLRNINKAELVARVAEISGPVYGGEEVNLKLGSKGQSNKPEYALDARALGSIYAGRINVIVNEEGVGVKTEAPTYATKGDVVISSKGKVYLKDTQTKGDIKISSTETEIGDKLVAENAINIESKKTKNSGQIQANKDITINGNVDSSNLISTNKDISISGDLKNSGKIEANKDINVKGNVENTKIILTNKDLNIKGDLTNTANIQAKNNIDINSKSIDNKGIIVAEKEISIKSNNINNSNKLVAKESLNINNKILTNSGKIYSGKETKIVNQKIDNTGDIASSGKINIDSIDIESNNILANGDISINTKELKSKGKIYSDKDIKLIANNIENNELTAKKLEIVADKLDNNTKILTANKQNIMTKTLVNKGMIYSSEEIDLKAVDLLNKGNILSIGNMSISQNKKIINDGRIQSNEDILINSKDIKNNKELIGKNVNIETDKLESTDKLIATNNMIVNSGALNNDSLIQASKMVLVGDTITNNGDILAVNDVTIKNKNLKNDGALINNKRIQSNNILKINIKDIKNNGIVFSKNKLNIESKNLSNKNEIVTNGKAIINSDILENDKTKGVIFSKDELDISSNKVNLTTNIGAGKLLKIQTNELERDESYITDSDLDIKIKGNYKNEYELIGKNLKLEANNLENNSIIASSGNTKIKGNNSFKNNENSLLYGRESLKLEGKDFTNKGDVSSFGNLNMNFAGDITNFNTIEAAGDGEITANNFTNKGYLTGSHSYKWVRGSKSSINKNNLPKEFIEKANRDVVRNKHGKFRDWDETEANIERVKEAESHYKSNKAYLKIGGNLTFNITNKVLNQEADILAGKNIIINAGELNNTREGKEADIIITFARKYHYRYWRGKNRTGHGYFRADEAYKQTLYADKPTQIIAGGNIIVNASKVGNGEYQEYVSGYTNSVKKVEKDSNIKNASIDDSFKITNNSIVEKIKKDSVIGIEEYIEIPKNDNGIFIINKKVGNPKFSYLIETNPKMIDKGFYLSSEYFFSRIKFNPDRDIRLLGDSFYENRLITRAVLEGTGKRYLYSNNVNEERKKLFDNAVSAQKDLNLSLGVALSKEQINNLKSDILWYVEEVVNGEKVLVPKLYLTKNTLNSITEEQGNIIKAGGSFVVNNASIVDNSGKIIAKNNVLIKSKNIYQNAAYSDTGIYANDVALIAKENIENIGGNIVADDNVLMYSENGDIKNSKKLSIHENDYHDVFTDVRGSGNIVGNNISIVANNVENLGADIKAENKIEIGAKKNLLIGNLEAVDKKVRDGGKDYVSDEKRTNVGSNLNAKDISLTSLGDIGISGSNIVATNEASIQAKGDIAVVAGKDSILHKEKHSKSKGFGRSESSTDIKYNEKLVPTQIIGKDVNITSEKNITVVGSNLLAENKLNVGAKEDINIISGKQGSSEVHQKTKTGFMKLSGRMSLEDNLKYENISSNVQAGKEVNLVSEKNVNVLASNISSKENINILAKKDVNILAGDNVEENYKKETKYRTSLFADFKGLNFEIGAKIKGSQTKEGIHKTTVASSNINAGKDLYIKSGNDTTIQAANFTSENTYVASDGKINIISKDNTTSTEFSNKEIEAKISAGVKLNGVKDTLKSTYQVVKGLKHLPDTIGIAKDLLKGQDLNEALVGKEKAIEEANLVANGPKTGEVGAGIYAGAKFSSTKGNYKITDSVGSNIVSKDTVSLKSKDDMKMQDININAKNILIDSDKNISIEAGKSTSTSKMSSISGDGEINLVTGQFNIGAGVSKDTSESVIYKNSKIIGENIKVKGQDFSIKGGNIIGNDVNINVANLHLESLQDKEKSRHNGLNVSAGNSSVGAGVEYGRKDKSWVNEQSSIIGKNSANITVGEKTNLIGSVIGGGNTTLRTAELEYSDIHDKDKGYNFGINGSASFSKNDKGEWDISKSIGANYGATDREQINRATIGAGTVIVDAKTVNPNINRDESKTQIVTRDINVGTVGVEYKENRRKWSDVSDIMGEYGKSLGSDLDKMTDGKYDLENKLGQGASDIIFEIEKVLDHDLKNGIFGIVPTKEYTGGIAGQLQSSKKRYVDGEQELVYAELTVVMDKNGKPLLDRKGALLVDSKTKIIGPNDKIDKNVRIKPLPANGVFNSPSEAIAGAAAATFTPDEDAALRRGETIKMLVIRNKSAGAIMDTTETLVTKLGGLVGNQNWGARSMENIYRAHPELLANNNWHSQSSINGTAAFLHMGKDPEGRALLANNVERLGLKGMAITKIGYTKLGNLLHGLNSNIDLFYMRNQKEPVSFFAAWWMPANTDELYHDNNRYNSNRFNFNSSTGMYEKNDVPIYNYQMRMMDGKDQRSIMERWKDKRAQEKRIGGK